MLRLISSRSWSIVRDIGHYLASHVPKKRASEGFPATVVSLHPHRAFSAGRAVWKDALQTSDPEEPETVDLDGWKSVMRSQAAFKEKQQIIEAGESDDGEDLPDPGGEPKAFSLEATRELVVMWRQAGKLVPQEMTDEEVETLSKITTKSGRKKHLKFLALKERYKLAHKKKQLAKKAEREAKFKERSKEEDGQSGDKGSKLFLTFWSRSLDKLLAWRTASAMIFGQPLVFDMSYESEMSQRELENAVSQLMEVEGWNRRATEPFHLHFCNLQSGGPYMQELLKRYGQETWDRLMVTTTDRQHVEVFPREQLVYLTADSPNVLRRYDHNKVYIIGAMVDKSINSGLSLANAKRLKLATARLPLDEFLHWEIGAKNLTLDQMIRIMLTIKDTGKWEEALNFVPKRKHDGFHQERVKNRGTPNSESREGGQVLRRFGETNHGKTLKNTKQSVYRRDSGYSGRDGMSATPRRENTSAQTKIRTSLKTNLEARKNVRRSNEWWKDE